MRSLDELINRDEPGIDLVRAWIGEATNSVLELPCDAKAGAECLLALQVTTRSPLGAIAFETGGLLVDRGWLRILGGGSPRLPHSLASWNRAGAEHRLPGALVVAYDLLGGFFALNGGRFPGSKPTLFYFAPECMEWEDTELGYSDWLTWAFEGDLAGYYGDSRWPGWEAEAAELRGDQCLSVSPPLFAQGPPLAKRSRRGVPAEELWGFYGLDDAPTETAR